ncbi:MAG: hypothetical protein L0Y72_30085 [Gemmataceae bacterium]|nr:hypothetical protein [Gemmataceae bacterium]
MICTAICTETTSTGIGDALVAERLEYEVHGTIGVIVRALRRQQRTKRQVLNLLRALPDRSTLFIQAKLLESVIEQIEKA